MKDEVIIFGSITKDKKLAAVFTAEYQDFLDKNPGRQIVMTVSLMPEKGTERQRYYFDKVVLPCLQSGFRKSGDDMNLNETLERVLDLCPATAKRDPSERLTKDQLSQLIDWSIRLCSVEFGIRVPEPGENIQ